MNVQPCTICSHPVRTLLRDVFDDRHGYPGSFTITQCPSCGFFRTEPPLTRDVLASVYQEYYPHRTLGMDEIKQGFEKARSRPSWKVWLEGGGLDCYRHVSPGSRVLDIGCGNCISLLMVKHLGAREAVGIDVDPSVRTIGENFGLDVHIGHLSSLPRDRGRFDFILARQVLEHEPDPRALLNEMTSRLEPGGRIILSFPHGDSLSRRICRRKWIHWHVPFHINHFTKKSISLLVEGCGLEIESMRTVTPNDWTRYQLSAMRTPVEPGRKNPFWDNGPALPTAPRERKVLLGLTRLLAGLATDGAICLANRPIDALGLGDGLLVILRNR